MCAGLMTAPTRYEKGLRGEGGEKIDAGYLETIRRRAHFALQSTEE